MGLTNKTEEKLRRMPKIEHLIRKSKNGKFVIQQTVITNIKPTAYYKKIVEDAALAEQSVYEKNESLEQFLEQQGEEMLEA